MDGVWSLLPSVNAVLNLSSAILLALGYRQIRRRKVLAHRALMIGAFLTSALFLISYLTYHMHHGTTRFAGEGGVRAIYLFILGTHTVLAAVVPPAAVWALFLAHRGRFVHHRAVTRWLFPIWMYVSVTGVLVYLMLYHL